MCCHAWLEAGKGLRRGAQLTKMSQFLKIKTSSALPPYYSFRAQGYALRVI